MHFGPLATISIVHILEQAGEDRVQIIRNFLAVGQLPLQNLSSDRLLVSERVGVGLFFSHHETGNGCEAVDFRPPFHQLVDHLRSTIFERPKPFERTRLSYFVFGKLNIFF